MRRFALHLAVAVVGMTTALLAQSAAGLRWTVPAGWATEAARPMRAATYAIPPSIGDKAPGECVVSFFGAGQGGTVEANIDRWKGQFQGADGKPAAAQVATRTSRGLKITTIDATGSYTGMGGPMAPTGAPAANYRLLGAIVEGPGGTVFVKFTGPVKTVAANQQKFEQMIASFQPEK
jgi:hypothetical protein